MPRRTMPFIVLAVMAVVVLGVAALRGVGGGGGLLGTAATQTVTSDPDAASWSDGRMDVFSRAGDNTLWHQWYANGAWAAPESLGGVLTSSPGVAAMGPGWLSVFVKGSDNALFHKFYSAAGWSAWEKLSGPNTISSDPAVVSWGAGRLDVFARGASDGLWHMWFESATGWHGPENLGGSFVGGPAVSSWGAGRLDVFARTSDNALQRRVYDATGWRPWAAVSSANTISSDPAAVSWGPNRIDVFARGVSDGLWHIWGNGGGWNGPENLGGALSGGPGVVSQGGGKLDVFTRGADGNLYQRAFQSGAWSASAAQVPAPDLSHVIEVRVIARGSSGISCPAGFDKNDNDLNTGADGDYIYLCIKRGPASQALTYFAVLDTADGQARSYPDGRVRQPSCAGGSKDPTDLNQGAGGAYIYFCYGNAGTTTRIKDINFTIWDLKPAGWPNPQKICDWGPGWSRALDDFNTQDDGGDLNRRAGGKYIYACVLH